MRAFDEHALASAGLIFANSFGDLDRPVNVVKALSRSLRARGYPTQQLLIPAVLHSEKIFCQLNGFRTILVLMPRLQFCGSVHAGTCTLFPGLSDSPGLNHLSTSCLKLLQLLYYIGIL